MQRDKVIILVVFLAAIGVTLGLRLNWGNGQNHEPASRPRRTPGVLEGQFRGIALQLANGDETHPFEQYVTEIADAGANTVCLVVAGYQENCSSACIFIDSRKCPTDARLRKLIAHAHKEGLRVLLMPIVLLENPRKQEWRGKIKPDNWDDWWSRYNSFLLHYAAIAADSEVEVFSVGSELLSTERNEKQWRDLISRVRKVAPRALLTYSANWDHYDVPKFWDALDIVGMTTYYDLAGDKKPTLETLRASWQAIRKEVLDWQAKTDRPLIFTEVGWPNQETAAKYPWNYYASENKPDPKQQSDCFQAFFDTWLDEPAVAGFVVWEWQNRPDQKVGPADTGYVPKGKPAMQVIEKAFRAGAASRPAGDTAATSAPSRGLVTE